MDRGQQDPRNPNSQPNPASRLHLNFGFNERSFTADAGRAFPTTPSTFPQPYPGQNGQQEVWGGQQAQNGYGNANYFMNNPFQAAQYQQQSSTLPPTPGVYRAPNGFMDGANGLAQQFAHQNLGPPRANSPYVRQPSPNGPAGARPPVPGSGSQYGPQLTPSNATQNGVVSPSEELPPRTPEKYSDNVYRRTKVTTGSVQSFFKENVQRARERNQRAVDLNEYLNDPNVLETRKMQKRQNMLQAEARFLRFLRTKEKASNFQTVKIIGKGAFGEVRLVTHKSDGKIYAMKSLVKSEMFKRDQLAHVRAERDILAESDNPWVVKLYTTFQDHGFLYMLMEFLPGGDLMTMLMKYDIFSDDITRFYMAELVLAIEAVHKLGFIHRDIKPDNILLDKKGHIKLTDFGLSTGFHKEHDQTYYEQLIHGKPNRNRDNRNSVSIDQIQLTVSNRQSISTWRKNRRQLAYSKVGTPDYIAPEIFQLRGYDFGCDWWSVGAIAFECLLGWPPFCSDTQDETYRKIVNWRQFLQFPPDAPLRPEVQNFVQSLMCDAVDRLGAIGGASAIKKHPFFNGVQFDQLRRIRAPFEPTLTSAIDTQYFPIDDIPQVDNTAAILRRDAENEDLAEMSLPFIGYTYKRFDAYRAG